MLEVFAADEYQDFATYRELAKIETNPKFKKVLEKLANYELEHFNFWLNSSSRKTFRVKRSRIFWLKLLRRILGLTFTIKFMERHEKGIIAKHERCLLSIRDELKGKLKTLIESEIQLERELISQIKEGKVRFISSIILGINDGLIELSGALVGFTFALHKQSLIAVTGLITGIAASLSMAASASMQARYEPGKSPGRVAIYTGSSYIVVVLSLVAPFFIIPNSLFAMITMLLIALVIISFVSFYVSVLLDRDFPSQLGLMLISSLGVSAVSFVIGIILRELIKT